MENIQSPGSTRLKSLRLNSALQTNVQHEIDVSFEKKTSWGHRLGGNLTMQQQNQTTKIIMQEPVKAPSNYPVALIMTIKVEEMKIMWRNVKWSRRCVEILEAFLSQVAIIFFSLEQEVSIPHWNTKNLHNDRL